MKHMQNHIPFMFWKLSVVKTPHKEAKDYEACYFPTSKFTQDATGFPYFCGVLFCCYLLLSLLTRILLMLLLCLQLLLTFINKRREQDPKDFTLKTMTQMKTGSWNGKSHLLNCFQQIVHTSSQSALMSHLDLPAGGI